MEATDIRDDRWRALRERLSGDRKIVWETFRWFGPATTRRAAELAQMDILAVRPRATELLQEGLLELVGRDGHEGVYKALTIEQLIERVQAAERPQQMVLL